MNSKLGRSVLSRFLNVLTTTRIELPADINSSDMFNVKYLSRYFPPDQVPDSWLNPSHLGNLMQHHLHRHNHDIFPILFFLVFFIISLLDNY